jgi:hypothetical protein
MMVSTDPNLYNDVQGLDIFPLLPNGEEFNEGLKIMGQLVSTSYELKVSSRHIDSLPIYRPDYELIIISPRSPFSSFGIFSL